jgi:hypothetical protein
MVCPSAFSALPKKSSAAPFPRIAIFGFHSKSSLVKEFPFSNSSFDTSKNSSPTHKMVVEAEVRLLVEIIFPCRSAVTVSIFFVALLRTITSSSLSLDFCVEVVMGLISMVVTARLAY